LLGSSNHGIHLRAAFSTENTEKSRTAPDSTGIGVGGVTFDAFDSDRALAPPPLPVPIKPQPPALALMKKEESIAKKAKIATLGAIKSLTSTLLKIPGIMWFYLTHPRDFRLKLAELKDLAVKEAHHYWMGSKLLAADIRTARHIIGRTLRGSTLSRRERKQLLRTVTDVFRVVPMSIFVLIPFMEFALPFALKLFPNMLPSTFQDSLKEEEKMKRELQMRISMAGFFQDTLGQLAKEQKKFAEIRKKDTAEESDAESLEKDKASTAASFLDFLKKARTGEVIPPDVIINFSRLFEDNLTLDNMGRMQLVNMCRYMGLPPYGNDHVLRFQLRHKVRVLKDDDQRILWEGIESLTKMELREACRERGMRSTGLSKDAYRLALQQWLELSVQRNVPVTLLIMSRTFFLHDEMVSGDSEDDAGSKSVSGLADAMSGLEKDVLNEIVLDLASSEEKSKNTDVMKIQLEVLDHQNEKIKEEQEEREAAALEKEKDKEKVEDEIKEEESAPPPTEREHGISEPVPVLGVNADDVIGGKGAVAEKIHEKEGDEALTGESKTVTEDTSDEDYELSTEEIEAISQLASPDPVHREREELERIKAAMLEDLIDEIDTSASDEKLSAEDEERKNNALETLSAMSPTEPMFTEDAQEEAVKAMKELEDEAEKEAMEATKISMQGDVEAEGDMGSDQESVQGDKKLQKAIDRLKLRVESMVGKIETQMTDVENKIGDKFHLLDKDMDGVLSMEEMAQVLQTVLKRKLTSEEAMAIAEDMDGNKDGVFSITELAQWAETNTIVRLVEDGREKEAGSLIAKKVDDMKEKVEVKVDEM